MTNKEAIEFLKNISSEEAGRCIGKEGTFYAELMMYHVEALHLAIKALEERPKGKWELFVERPFQNVYMCSNCGHLIESMPDRLAENFKGCYCGADMRGDV